MMKRFLHPFVIVLFATFNINAQNWTWIRGSAFHSVTGKYGTKGVPSPANDPGVRHGCATWTDKDGNLWLFGGEGYDTTANEDLLNDLWKYDRNTNQWTWMRGSQALNSPGNYGTLGVSSPLNYPGAREFCMSWTDTSGKFWLFGGEGYIPSASGEGALGDLWRYDPLTNEWTWMKGFSTHDQLGVYGTMGTSAPGNMPGCRHGSGYWVDANNNLWLMGGEGFPAAGGSGMLHDLWRYSPATNEWTWVKGTSQTGQLGAYGTAGVPAPTNLPGGRSFPVCWQTPGGDAYMLGGVGFSTLTIGMGRLGDFWKYEASTNNWTWVSGHNGVNKEGTYGTLGQSSATVHPGAREGSAAWTDALGKLWLFGGNGYAAQMGSIGVLNDMFRFDPTSGEWSWQKGDSTVNVTGKYGTMGATSPHNNPGGRYYNTYWKHTGSQLWLFGGLGKDSVPGISDNMNDLWLFSAPCNPDAVGTSASELCSGTAATLSVIPPDNSAITWYSGPTTSIAIGSGSSHVTAPLTAVTTQSIYTYYVSVATCSGSARAARSITVHPLPQMSINGPATACEGDVITLSVTGANSYTWTDNSTSSVTTLTAAVPGHSPVVLGKSIFGCDGSATLSITVHPVPQVTAVAGSTLVCKGDPFTFTASGASTYSWNTGDTTATLMIANITASLYTVMGYNSQGCSSAASVTVEVANCDGLGELLPGSFFSIFPNPSDGRVTINVQAGFGEGILEVLNNLGQIIYSEELNSGTNELQRTLPAGIYYFRLTDGISTRQVSKLIIR